MNKYIAAFLMSASMALASPTAPLNFVLEWLEALPKPEKWNFKDGWTYQFSQNIGKDDPLKISLIDGAEPKKGQKYTYDKRIDYSCLTQEISHMAIYMPTSADIQGFIA